VARLIAHHIFQLHRQTFVAKGVGFFGPLGVIFTSLLLGG
jgi:hypothetical protein